MQTIRTQEKRDLFLKTLNDFWGNVSKACAAAGISRTAAYSWKDEDDDFSEAWDDVVESTTEQLESEAYRRAYEGWEEPVYQGGKHVGTVRRFDSTLAMFMLKGRRPETYRDNAKVELSGPGGQTLKLEVVNVTSDQQQQPDT